MKRTVREFQKAKGQRLVYVTAYDYPTARLAEEAGVDAILVGDSLGMVVLGYESTVPVTLEEMLHHTKAARRGAPRTFLVADLPYLSYATLEHALQSAKRLIKEGGADAVKLEGGKEVVEVVKGLVRAGVPVLGHVGLTPQTASILGGFRLQGKDLDSARRILEDALALEEAGVFGVVLELVPAPLARLVTERLSVHTIGIGAGPFTDAQVLVFHDLVGLFEGFKPRFVKRYLEAAPLFRQALARYAEEVRSGLFPGEEHSFEMAEEVLQRLYEEDR
ncbi:MAG: 3-methyl-2-oxobutanoate hydroxymethyltransferase [Thermus sp.]|uniref:3-methyl-2-oxobutanoate hydroxymethyltransferase n=1 Tax=Thermus sp. TaxID=275 RepID=UPI0033216485